jgi:hypothetical protein
MKKLKDLNLGQKLSRNEMKVVNGGRGCFLDIQCEAGARGPWGDGMQFCDQGTGKCVHAGISQEQ